MITFRYIVSTQWPHREIAYFHSLADAYRFIRSHTNLVLPLVTTAPGDYYVRSTR
jgi:hypothetical protein